MYILGLDFGGVISQGKTTDDLMPGVIEAVNTLSSHFNAIYIVSRVDDVDSRDRVFYYMNERNLWDSLNIPVGNIRFCLRREDKANICQDLNITHFVDDHTEILLSLKSVPFKFAMRTKPAELIEYPPGDIPVFQSWTELAPEIKNTVLRFIG